jgi:hypothetical protein
VCPACGLLLKLCFSSNKNSSVASSWHFISTHSFYLFLRLFFCISLSLHFLLSFFVISLASSFSSPTFFPFFPRFSFYSPPGLVLFRLACSSDTDITVKSVQVPCSHERSNQTLPEMRTEMFSVYAPLYMY